MIGSGSDRVKLALARFQDKNWRLLMNIFASFFARSINLLCSIITVPLATSALNTRDYGIFAVFLSIASFFTYADFGLGLAVVNKVASAHTRRGLRDAKRAVSSIAVFLVALSALLLLMGVLGVLAVANRTSFGLETEQFIRVSLTVLFCCAAGLAPSLAQRMFFALQRNFEGNLWLSAGRIGSVAACTLANWNDGGLAVFLFAMLGVPVAISWLSVLHLVYTRPELAPRLRGFSFLELKRNAVQGFYFSTLQIAVFAESGLDRIFISYFVGPEDVGSFDLQARLFAYIPALVSIGSFPLWPALREALDNDDLLWARRLLKMAYLVGLLACGIAAIFLFVYHREIILIWTGVALSDAWSLVGALAVFGILSSLGTIQSMAANAQGLIGTQAKIQGVFLIVLVLAKVAALRWLGISDMIWVMNFLYIPRLIYLELYVSRTYSAGLETKESRCERASLAQ